MLRDEGREKADLQHVLPDLLPAGEPVQSGVLATRFADGGVLVQNGDQGQVVALAQLVVHGVVGRGDLQCPRSELAVHALVRDHCGRREGGNK